LFSAPTLIFAAAAVVIGNNNDNDNDNNNKTMIWVVLAVLAGVVLMIMLGLLVYLTARLGKLERMLHNTRQFAQRARDHTLGAVTAASHAVRQMTTQDPVTGVESRVEDAYRYREPEVVHDLDQRPYDTDSQDEDKEGGDLEAGHGNGLPANYGSGAAVPATIAYPTQRQAERGFPTAQGVAAKHMDIVAPRQPMETTSTPARPTAAGNGRADRSRYTQKLASRQRARKNGLQQQQATRVQATRVQSKRMAAHQRNLALIQKQQQMRVLQRRNHQQYKDPRAAESRYRLSSETAGKPPRSPPPVPRTSSPAVDMNPREI